MNGTMKSPPSRIALTLASLVWAACGSSGDGANDPDGGDLAPPAECALSAPPGGWQYPAGPYGRSVGDTFEDFTLEDCAGNQLRFGDVLSQSEMVLFNIGAGWCQPCIDETATLDGEIFREFCPRGLQVVQVLFQDEQSRPATSLFCEQWTESFGLSFPVLRDPLFVTMKYFESVQSQTPINFLIDRSGKIVFKSTGAPPDDLAETISQMLP